MAITTAKLSPEESIHQQLQTWAFETESNFINSSKEAVARFAPKLPSKSTVIDLGCGDGAATPFFKEAGIEVIGVDINQAKLDRNPTTTVCDTIANYLQRTKTLSNIFIHHALEHLPNPQEVLDLISRKLNSGGLVYIEVPADDHIHSVHHSTFDSPDDLLPEGFIVVEKDTVGGEHYLIARKK